MLCFLVLGFVILKYLIEGIAVGFVLTLLRGNLLNINEVLTIALMASLTMMILDSFSPQVAQSTRQGMGFGIGYNLVGGTYKPNTNDFQDDRYVIPTIDQQRRGIEYQAPSQPWDNQEGGYDDTSEIIESDGIVDTTSSPKTNNEQTQLTQQTEQTPQVEQIQEEEDQETLPKPRCSQRPTYRVPYHVVDNQYSDKAVLAGYNEDVVPANTPNILDSEYQTILDDKAVIPQNDICHSFYYNKPSDN